MGRKSEIQTSRTNSHPKFSQTSPSKQRSSVQLSEAVTGTGARNVGNDEMDCSTRSLAHSWFQEQRYTVPGPFRGKVLDLVNLCTWSEQTRELNAREAFDDSPSTAGQRKTFQQLSKHTEAEVDDIGHPTCSRTSCSPLAVPEEDEGEKDEPTEKPAEDGEVQLEPPETTMAPGASSSSRGEKHTETQEATSVKNRPDDGVINREANSHGCRRPCQTKTDGENRHEERRRAHAAGHRGFVIC